MGGIIKWALVVILFMLFMIPAFRDWFAHACVWLMHKLGESIVQSVPPTH